MEGLVRGSRPQHGFVQTLCGGVILLGLAFAALPEDALFIPGTLPLDTDGNPVHAHGGGILKVKDTFYWFGESYKRPLQHDFLSEGVNLYSSTDLFTWHYEGLVFNGTAQMKGMPVEAPFRIERPKILYNARYNNYVLLFHADTPSFSYPAVGVAVADDITGPYTWVRAFKPDGLDSFDMGVFQEADGTAFLVRSVNNQYVGISQLSPDYTDTLGISSTAPRGEGPAVFKPANSSYFMMASHLTGWSPNAPMLFHSSAPSLFTATWAELPVPATGEGANITYNSQSTFVFQLQFDDGTTLYIYMGDRWNFYGPGSVENATYVWLPLVPRTDGLGYELHYEAKWRPSDYRDRARVAVAYNTGAAVPLPAAAAAVPPGTAATETTAAGAGAARVQSGGVGGGAAAGGEPIGAAAKMTPVNPPAGLAEFSGPSASALSKTPAAGAPPSGTFTSPSNGTTPSGTVMSPAAGTGPSGNPTGTVTSPGAGRAALALRTAADQSFMRRAVSRVEAWLSG